MACSNIFKNLSRKIRSLRRKKTKAQETIAIATVDSCTQTPLPEPPKHNIFWLPRELLLNIANRLGPAEIIRLSWINKRMYRIVHRPALWKARIEREFGPKGHELLEPDSTVAQYISAYRKLIQPFVTSCADWEYAWLQSGYWEINANENSKFQKTADLSKTFVWWLHGHKTLLVQPGIYKITWALQLQTGAVSRSILDAVSLNVVSQNAPSGHADVAYRILFGSIRNQIPLDLPDTFHEFEMPGYIRIPFADALDRKDWCRVKFEIRDTESQRPKSGINLDYVKLTPIDSTSAASKDLNIIPYSTTKESSSPTSELAKSLVMKAEPQTVFPQPQVPCL